MAPACAFVITSYSIHYTKLYEAPLVYQECRFACESSTDAESCAAFEEVTLFLCKTEGDARCRELCGSPDEKQNQTACAFVITSYSIHYTKLYDAPCCPA